MDVAHYMKNTPDAFNGIEIFDILFWADDGNNSCWDISVFDTGTSLFPACGPDTSSLPPVAQRSHDAPGAAVDTGPGHRADHCRREERLRDDP